MQKKPLHTKQEVTNNCLEDKIDSIRREMGEYRHQEELQHNAKHRFIMQYERIYKRYERKTSLGKVSIPLPI